jgi:hypothetical protein
MKHSPLGIFQNFNQQKRRWSGLVQEVFDHISIPDRWQGFIPIHCHFNGKNDDK